MDEQVYNRYYDTAGNYHWIGVHSGEHIVRKGEKMEIEYSGIDESLVKWRYNTEPWHTAYITDLIAKWESDKAKENTFVKHISTVAVRPVVYGKWIKDRLCSTSGGTYGVYRCSVCEDCYQDIGYGWNYCPNCGARMDEREDEQ